MMTSNELLNRLVGLRDDWRCSAVNGTQDPGYAIAMQECASEVEDVIIDFAKAHHIMHRI